MSHVIITGHSRGLGHGVAENFLQRGYRVLGLSLPEGEGYSTVAGLCIARIGAVPEQGARLQAGDAELEVVDATPRLVRRLRVRRTPADGG